MSGADVHLGLRHEQGIRKLSFFFSLAELKYFDQHTSPTPPSSPQPPFPPVWPQVHSLGTRFFQSVQARKLVRKAGQGTASIHDEQSLARLRRATIALIGSTRLVWHALACSHPGLSKQMPPYHHTIPTRVLAVRIIALVTCR